MSAAQQPGPWRVEPWSGGCGYPAGFYLARTLHGGKTEWLQSHVSAGARLFRTREAAEIALTILSQRRGA